GHEIEYAEQFGHYHRSGRNVWFRASLKLSRKGRFAGKISIGGLPAPAAPGSGAIPISVFAAGLTNMRGQLVGVLREGQTRVDLFHVFQGQQEPLADRHLTDTAALSIQGYYSV